MSEILQELKDEIKKVVVGQEDMIEALIIGLISDGHILLEGVPGLAKTTAIKTLGECCSLEFKRVQFTPDLLPSDLTGAEIYSQKEGEFKIKKGPIFTNLLLADEINRAPAKVQSALLEAMQEKQVTIAEQSFEIDKPFLVLATQNPIESEGAYNLPEAQLDRFMLKAKIDYNSKDEEIEIAKRVTSKDKVKLNRVLDKKMLEDLKDRAKAVHIDTEVERYMADIIFATRYPKDFNLKEIEEFIRFGASPRATIDMFKCVKATAMMQGRDFVTPVDVARVAKPILRHRIILSYEAEAQEIESDFIIDKILQRVDIP